jgi:hypothetical protein
MLLSSTAKMAQLTVHSIGNEHTQEDNIFMKIKFYWLRNVSRISMGDRSMQLLGIIVAWETVSKDQVYLFYNTRQY